jgi:hypothetical protein
MELDGWNLAGREHDATDLPHVIVATDADGRRYACVSIDHEQRVGKPVITKSP